MRLVVDANVLFSAFLRKGVTRQLILDRRLELFAPEFLIDEYTKHSNELIERSGLEKDNALRLISLLFARIVIVKTNELLLYKDAAKHLTTDENDEAYIACALATRADLWSRDRHLKTGRIRCWSTEELAKKLILKKDNFK
ncbi:MAG: PIN domain-containing protein [Candidatus Aenigmatarchaeota archaeon]